MRVARQSDAAPELADELKDFELSVNDNATPQWGARAGTHMTSCVRARSPCS